MKHTKIVATVGPASESKDMLRALADTGVNVFRLNFSHNEHAWHRDVINRIREVSAELGMPIGILADLQGPRIRVDGESAEFSVAVGQKVRISDISRKEFLPEWGGVTVFLDIAGISDALEVGHELQRGGGEAKVVGHGVSQREHAQGELVDLHLVAVDALVEGAGLAGAGGVALDEGAHRLVDGALAAGPHREEAPAELAELHVEVAVGVALAVHP